MPKALGHKLDVDIHSYLQIIYTLEITPPSLSRVAYFMYSPFFPLKRASSQIRLKITLIKRNIRAPKVRRIQRSLGNSRQALPCNKWFSPSNCGGQAAGVVERPDGLVFDEGFSTREGIFVG
jgi:hypothetical protein